MRRIVQIVSSIENEASGPSYTVPRLAWALAAEQCEVSLMSLGFSARTMVDGYWDIRFNQDWKTWPVVSRLGLSRAMRKALDEAAQEMDILHTHGLWMMPNVYPAWVAKKHGKPLVLAPRGMLGPAALKFSANAKRFFGFLLQDAAVRTVSCFHATCEEEYRDIRAYGLTQPVAIVPNGIDVPPELPSAPRERPEPRTVLSLGRIHPKKALDKLILAWKEVERDFPDWCLKIVGPSEVGYEKELMSLVAKLDVRSVIISGPVFGHEKQQLLQQAELFALSTLHENFGMTVAESLAVGTPVISTKGAPWRGLEEHGCGWWIEHGVEPFAAALREAMSLTDDERAAMGRRGRDWMQRDFSWQHIAQEMVKVYQWLIDGGEPPQCVKID